MLTINKLSETNLLDVLICLYPNSEINKQCRITIQGKVLIVDYEVVFGAKLIYVEFDGPTHYTDARTQIRDTILKQYCSENNIELIRLPYFVQLNNYSIGSYFKHLISMDNLITTDYGSGFIDKKITYPSTFNKQGWKVFFEQLDNLDTFTAMDIANTLLDPNKNTTITVGLDMDYEAEKLYTYIKE